jgi:hypothetical protein
MRIKLFVILFFLWGCVFSQSVTTPPQKNFTTNTTNQDASGFIVNGFNSTQTLLLSIGLINPSSGTTLRITNTSGIVASLGYNLNNNFTRISFTGTQTNINNALQSLKANTGSSGVVNISVSVTLNPSGYFYLPSNGHFYRPMNWPGGLSGGDAVYNQIKNLASGQTFKGQTGYLVTITSQDEQNFIQANVPGSNILIALTDRQQEGVWRWDAGPESGTIIKTSNSGGNVSGQYNNWCSGEPNNWGSGENYAVTKWGGGNCWNDFGPPASSFPGSISGYVVEFGTWSDPSNQTFTDFYTGTSSNPIIQPVPFTYSGTIFNSNNVGVSNIVIELHTTPKGLTNYSLHSSYITNSLGIFSIQTTIPTSNTDFRIIIKSPSLIQTNTQDIEYLYNIIFTNQKTAQDYYKFDINLSDDITISDIYSLYVRNLGGNLHSQTPTNRYFKQNEWGIISSSTENLLQQYQGSQNLILNNVETGLNENFYLIRLGKKD